MSNETVTEVDGVKTTLPAEELADLQPKPVEEPAKVEETKEQPKPEAEPKVEPEAPKEQQDDQPRDEQGKFKPKKAGPIASLLEKKHELETALETERREKAELQAKLQSLADKPASQANTDKIRELAEKHNADPELLEALVQEARSGLTPQKLELPKEILALVEQNKRMQEQQAEQAQFDAELNRLQATFNDDLIGANRDKLLELAYSTEKAPDGEAYYQKPLFELWTKYVKPQVEPGRKTAESSRGGTGGNTEILDFAEIANDPKAIERLSDSEWKQFMKWQEDTQKGSPMQRPK